MADRLTVVAPQIVRVMLQDLQARSTVPRSASISGLRDSLTILGEWGCRHPASVDRGVRATRVLPGQSPFTSRQAARARSNQHPWKWSGQSALTIQTCVDDSNLR